MELTYWTFNCLETRANHTGSHSSNDTHTHKLLKDLNEGNMGGLHISQEAVQLLVPWSQHPRISGKTTKSVFFILSLHLTKVGHISDMMLSRPHAASRLPSTCRSLWAATVPAFKLTLPKSLTSKRSKGSNSSLLRRPNLSWQTLRNVRMFFKHRNCKKQTEKSQTF